MPHDRQSLILVASFVAVSAGFVAATSYTEIRASSIDREVSKIEDNSLPSVEHLAAARAALRHLDASAAQYAGAEASRRPVLQHQMDEARSGLRHEIEVENETGDYPGEEDARTTTMRALRGIDSAVALFEAPGGPTSTAAYEEIHRRIDECDDGLTRWLDINARQGHQELGAVIELRHRSALQSALLGGACVALSIVAALVTLGSLRKQRKLEAATEEALRHRARELDMFATRVAHDLLNPLSAISFTLTSVRRATEKGEDAKGPLARAEGALRRTRRLVEGVLEFARSGAPVSTATPTNLREAVDGVVDEVRSEGAEVSLVVEALPDAYVACAQGVLTSILGNLIRNAVKYSAGSPVRRVTIDARTTAEPARVRVEVKDTGPGLPKGFEARAFEAYQRAPDTGQPGLGLGLATVKRFVTAHGGDVGVVTTLGSGCLFWFELPTAETGPGVGEASAPSSLAEGDPPVVHH